MSILLYFICMKKIVFDLGPDLQQYYKTVYRGFHMYCDCDSQQDTLKFYHRDGVNHTLYDAFSKNNLWYHSTTHEKHDTNSDISHTTHPSINRLHKAAKHELWHQRLMHPGKNACATYIK